ncbi:MAG TPA: tetratricopeptide repeat protein [Janthinobacterium sp.]|jgi:hypothetical protein|nr:tetratricopeptide repeat protein [Janthinobacterium sp.]
MELFNKSGIGLVSVLLLIGSMIACQSKDEMLPSPAQIEATALTASQGGEASAERRVREWAEQGLPVAQRELGMLYRNRLERRAEAIALLEKAARAGDAEAAFQLGEMYRMAAGGKPEPAKAWPWYKMAAENKHSTAALTLALLMKSGDGVSSNPTETAKWLTLASNLGNSHAMFLLHNAYQEGNGVPRDSVKGRQLLEEAARRDYPPAVQEMAVAAPSDDRLTPKEDLRASTLLKAATGHNNDGAKRF